MLQAVVRKLAEKFQERYPEEVELILKQLYVDDLLGYAKSSDHAKRQILNILKICESAMMKLRKFSTNNPGLRKILEKLNIS